MWSDTYSFQMDITMPDAVRTFSGVMVVDNATDIITEIFQDNDNSMTNLLYTIEEGDDTGFITNHPTLGKAYKVYSTREGYDISYDNFYDKTKLTFDEIGVVMKSLGPDIDTEAIKYIYNSENYLYSLSDHTFGDVTSNAIYLVIHDVVNGLTEFYPTLMTVTPLNVSCFAENTTIMTTTGPVVIKHLAVGSEVPTLTSGNKTVVSVGKRVIKGYSFQMYGYGDCGLEVTGKHSVLVDKLSEEQIEQIPSIIGSLKQTEGKWLLPACLDETTYRVSLYGDIPLYHVVLENEDDNANYGILANGMWVESCSKNDFDNFSQMDEINLKY